MCWFSGCAKPCLCCRAGLWCFFRLERGTWETRPKKGLFSFRSMESLPKILCERGGPVPQEASMALADRKTFILCDCCVCVLLEVLLFLQQSTSRLPSALTSCPIAGLLPDPRSHFLSHWMVVPISLSPYDFMLIFLFPSNHFHQFFDIIVNFDLLRLATARHRHQRISEITEGCAGHACQGAGLGDCCWGTAVLSRQFLCLTVVRAVPPLF